MRLAAWTVLAAAVCLVAVGGLGGLRGEQLAGRAVEEVAGADAEWLPALRSGHVQALRPFLASDAYADKFVARLEDGRLAMVKLVAKHSLLGRALRLLPFSSSLHASCSRAEAGPYQGMPELAAWHVDRILAFHRKPPVAGRVLSSAQLYPSLLPLPAHPVPVTLHAWINGLRTQDPHPSLRAYLTAPSLLPPPPSLRDTVADISDVLVADFLVDDHDRAAEKNWVLHRERYLQWDSGLAFHHGPEGHDSCLDILCASNRWRRKDGSLPRCRRICVFRKSTVDLLTSMGPSAPDSNKLGFLLRESLQADELFPAFQFPVYYADASEDQVVRFPAESFFDGMDVKVERLLQHIDGCIALHGRETVLL